MNKIIKVIGNFEDLYHGNGASVDSIKEAEKKLKTKFSEEYYDYLCAFGTATFDGDEFTGEKMLYWLLKNTVECLAKILTINML